MLGEFRLPRAELQPIYRKVGESYIEISNRMAVVGENGKVYDIVSDRYELILHEDVVKNVRKVLRDLEMLYKEKIKVSMDGGFMVAKYILGDREVQGDKLKVGFSVTNSYDRSSGINVTGYLFRLVCKNGLMVAEDLLGHRFRHYGYLADNDYNALKNAIKLVVEQMDEVLQLIQMAQKETVSVLDIVHFVETTFKNSKRLRLKIYNVLKNQLGIDIDYWIVVYKGTKRLKNYDEYKEKADKVNLWESINGITYVLSHYKLDEKIRYEFSKKTSQLLKLAIAER